MIAFNKNLLVIVAGLAAAFAILSRGRRPLNLEQLRALSEQTVSRHKFKIDPRMMVRIAWIESGGRQPVNPTFNPLAVRFEPKIGDASTGLFQTLVGTAREMAKIRGYRAFGVPEMSDLFDPETSAYFGGAYLDYLRTYAGKSRTEEWIVRSYNGGPGHGTKSTQDYWNKYLQAKAAVG
ncbi:MAG: lytic transglycosylase domain-containing protein [Minwuiales bacterium]|nr:lytic transglycosylase domain-containing protein [Minwuiales bacterium]